MPRLSPRALSERRQAILDAVLPVFAEKGFDGATIVDLEAATALSRGALFHHFQDKLGLFEAAARHDRARSAEQLAAIGFPDVLLWRLRPENRSSLGIYVRVLSLIKDNPLFREHWSDGNQLENDNVNAMIRSNQEAGRWRADIEVEVIATFLAVLNDGLLLRAAVFEDNTDPVTDLVELVERALEAPAKAPPSAKGRRRQSES